jgi:uncharacterized membrane protein YhhN
MPRTSAIVLSPWLAASLLASVSYFLFGDNPLPEPFPILWKGAAVACLAVYAAVHARNADGWLLASVMASGALGDMVLELDLLAGAGLFAVGHLFAIALFLRNLRTVRSRSQRLAAIFLSICPALIAALMTMPDPRWPLASGYAAVVGAMAAAAWSSRFPRYRVGIGAVLFVASDLLILAREAGDASASLAWWLVWPLYYAGQFLIATGVVRTLRTDRA